MFHLNSIHDLQCNCVGCIMIISWCKMNCKKWVSILVLCRFLVLLLVKCSPLDVFVWINTTNYCMVFHFRIMHPLFVSILQCSSLVVVGLWTIDILVYLKSIWCTRHGKKYIYEQLIWTSWSLVFFNLLDPIFLTIDCWI
jgi:hypothetical protein